MPFALNHEAVKNIIDTKDLWTGSIPPNYIGNYVDLMLVLIFGGIPWQVYFQRVLSAKTEKAAMYLSYIAAFGCFLMAIPSVLIGAIARSTSTHPDTLCHQLTTVALTFFETFKIGMRPTTM